MRTARRVAVWALHLLRRDATLSGQRESAASTMKPEERTLLQERVKTLVLGQALDLALSRLAESGQAAGRDAEATLASLEDLLLSAARSLADRATTQKLAVLVAVEDVSATLKAAFDGARAKIDRMRPADAPTETTAAAA